MNGKPARMHRQTLLGCERKTGRNASANPVVILNDLSAEMQQQTRVK